MSTSYYEKEILYLCFDKDKGSFVTDDLELARRTELETSKSFQPLPFLAVDYYSELAL